jgi:hypothetical protein
MFLFWILGAALVAVACKEITWRHFGDIVVFVGVVLLAIVALVMVVTNASTVEKLMGLTIFVGFAYATA